MPSVEQLRIRLQKKLKELFQLDQPDLDFGFYRIMHARARQVQEFIDKDLLLIVEKAFGQVDANRRAELQGDYENAIREAREEYDSPNPENTPKAKKAKAVLDALRETERGESDVYDHLFRFFERYYDDGDFISQRYYTRETAGRAAPFAVPYNGEEVKLHWANADQYYIKTAEYFSHTTFDLRQATELRPPGNTIVFSDEQSPLRMHCRIIEATEGEHGNVKASDATKRTFVIHAEKPVDLTSEGELILYFEYRPDPEQVKREKRNAEAVETVLAKLAELVASDKVSEEYLRVLKRPIESDKNRPLLAKYINQYTARNTMDYFIHKDLGGFLRRELDFYIKNEVMRLDDIEHAEAPAVESYLAKIKVLRKIAGKLIEFLAQLENFQKKLWLKKKFVVETNYCITLDRVSEEFYPVITVNDMQREEWVKLFAIDEITTTEGTLDMEPVYSIPLTVEFLKANKNLVLDTRFFDEQFKDRLIASIENFDEQCDGLLIHSENFQALNLLQKRYREQVKCIYIDPPYNANSSEIIYKNSYKHSSWLSLMENRIQMSKSYLTKDFVNITAIDEVEQEVLGRLFSEIFNTCEKSCISIVHNATGQQGSNFSYTHEFAYFIFPKPGSYIGLENREDTPDVRPLRNVSKGSHLRSDAANCFYPIFIKDEKIIGFGNVSPDNFHPENINIKMDDGSIAIYPIDPQGVERKWVFARDTVESILDELEPKYDKKKNQWDIIRTKKNFNYKTVWTGSKYSANSYGSRILNDILPSNPFTFPKSIHTVHDCIDAGLNNKNYGLILDYFAGSGTTGHAVINLNREDDGKRKYVLVEMGDYFDSVTKPRITKVVYSENWKDGKPVARNTGVSNCFKYLRLESYEDTLNNLRFADNSNADEHTRHLAEQRNIVLANSPSLREDYMLHYMLDVETRGSQSLLNIDAFADPTMYMLTMKKPGSDEYVKKNVDLVETFNYLIGLRVEHSNEPQTFTADFVRPADPELPQEQHTKLLINGSLQQETGGAWWFRSITGWIPADPANPNNGDRTRVLVIWRRLTGDQEKDNLMLDKWFQQFKSSATSFDTIYVNGSNNLANLKHQNERLTVLIIEKEFMTRMWDTDG